MLIAATVCPHPPLLVPAATGRQATGRQASGRPGDPPATADDELAGLRAACRGAVAALRAEQADLIVAVGGGARTAEYPPDAAGSLAAFGVPFTVGQGAPVLPLALTVGRWLLAASPAADGADAATTWWSVSATARARECLELGEKLAALAPRVAMLVLGDGPGRRARDAPGVPDPAADRYDADVTAALGGADCGALAALKPKQDTDLLVAGRPAWQVLAGAAGSEPFEARLDYAAAPFEVSYAVARWRRPH